MKKHPGQFKPGSDARRCMTGRKKCGRSRAIALIDEICDKAKNLRNLKKKLQVLFDVDPVVFFNTIIVPLRPREIETLDDSVGFAAMTPAEAAAQMDASTVPEESDGK